MAGPLSRRRFLAGLAGGSALAALGQGGIAVPAGAQTFNWRKHAGAKLRVLTLKFPLSEIQQARLAEFEQLTGIKVQWEMLPEDLWRQKVKVEHLGGATDLDVFLSYYAQEGKQFFTSGWYTDMRPMIRNPELTSPDFAWDDFIPNVRDAATIEGQVPIIPDRAAALPILYYRRDLFQQFKLERPKTWQDVKNAAKVIHEGTNKQVFGIVLRGKGAAATSMFAPVLYDFGGQWFNRTSGDVAFNTPEALAAFEWWGSILREYGPPGSVNNHWAEVTSIFSQGRAAMLFDDITFITIFADPSKSTVAGKVGYALGAHGPAVRRLAGPAALPAERQRAGDLGARQAEGGLLGPRAVPQRQDDVEAVHAEGRPGAAPVGVGRSGGGEGARSRVPGDRPRLGADQLPRRGPALHHQRLEGPRLHRSGHRDRHPGGQRQGGAEHRVHPVRRPPQGGAREEVVTSRGPASSSARGIGAGVRR